MEYLVRIAKRVFEVGALKDETGPAVEITGGGGEDALFGPGGKGAEFFGEHILEEYLLASFADLFQVQLEALIVALFESLYKSLYKALFKPLLEDWTQDFVLHYIDHADLLKTITEEMFQPQYA